MYTSLQLAEKVLSETGEPMTAAQIWSYAEDKGYSDQCGLHGKTPDRTMCAQLYINIRDHADSRFVKVSLHPVRFGLRSRGYDRGFVPREEKVRFVERDLHPLLVAFLDSNLHLG